MAGDLMSVRALLAMAMCCAAISAIAAPEMLADPTRPPVAAMGGDFASGADAATSRLTSVVLPRHGGRPSAVISGQVVQLGGMVGEARLVRVTESEAVLEGPEGLERLYLTPEIDKKMNVNKAAQRRKRD